MIDLAARERIAAELLGQAVKDGETMFCPWGEMHSKPAGSRDLRVCLTEGLSGEAPGFYCFHQSCAEPREAAATEFRKRVWRVERGLSERMSDEEREALKSRPAPEPKVERPKILSFDAALLAKWRRPGIDRAWFLDRSPVEPESCSSIDFLNLLYEPGEKVLVFTEFASQGQFGYCVPGEGVKGGGLWRLGRRPEVKPTPAESLPKGGENGVWFLDQPVDGQWHGNPRAVDRKTGRPKQSRRSMESVTAWRYLVLESDEADEVAWLCLLAQLPVPIAAIYTSGGKSIHALVRVDAASKQEWDETRRMLLPLFTSLGADGGALTAVRLTRLPGCLRGKRRQELLYVNPKPGNARTCEAIAAGGNLMREDVS